MKYEIIMFDADDTLFDFSKAEKEAFRKTMLDYGFDYDEKYHYSIYAHINNSLWKDFDNGLITQEKLKYERFRKFFEKLQADMDEYEFAKSYMMNLSQSSFLYDDSMSLVQDLSRKYRLTIITNGLTAVQHNRVRNSSIGKYMDDVVISEEVGLSKPDKRIFEHALNNIGCTDRHKVLMVGDSLTTDIQGGINAGIDTCWFNPGKIQNTTRFKPTYEIHSLTALRTILVT
ncbi:MAG: YjjG family noncanonical pyrimidine nucleotidase [Sedimentibacter sp.]|uniref:YjjG family noncanonical pyrimidine nucleotidase n=1 Tax=Sedimentibacter sp. TaxID=1960295 RepID=UPI0031593DB1